MRRIIYLDRNGLYIAGGDISTPITMGFDPNVVRDLEIINFEALEKQISELLTKSKVPPSEAMIVLGHSFYLRKDIPAETKEDEFEKQKKLFLDFVPFEEVASNVYPIDKIKTIVATNKEFIIFIKNIFDSKQFMIEGISPLMALYPNQNIQFSSQVAENLLKHYAVLKQASLPLETTIVNDGPVDDFVAPETENKNNRALILGVVFLLLLFILGGLLWFTRGRNSSSNQQSAVISPTRAPQAAGATTSTISPAPTAEPADKSALRITILNGSGIPGQAEEIRSLLEENDYQNIQTGNAPTIQATSTQIVYRSTVPVAVREEIVTLIQNTIGEVSASMNDEIEEDIRITTAANSNSNTPVATGEASQP